MNRREFAESIMGGIKIYSRPREKRIIPQSPSSASATRTNSNGPTATRICCECGRAFTRYECEEDGGNWGANYCGR